MISARPGSAGSSARSSLSSSPSLIFRNGVAGAAITVIVVDDTIVRWMSDIDLPGIDGVARVVSYAASWWVIEMTIWVLTWR